MKKGFLVIFVVVWSYDGCFSRQSLSLGGDFVPEYRAISEEVSKNELRKELNKELTLIRFIDPSNARIEFEMDVWKHFIQTVDTSLIGFVFYVPLADKSFHDLWEAKIQDGILMVIDEKGLTKQVNQVSDDSGEQTFVLSRSGEVLAIGGSPIVADNFDKFRSVMARALLSKGIRRGVTGAIFDPETNGRSWFMNEEAYLMPSGETIPKDEALKLVLKGYYIPQYSPLSDTVKLIKR